MALSPNLRRYLPFILIAFVLLILLPALFKHKSSTSTSTPAIESVATIKAMNLVDGSELSYQASHGRYTAELADLVVRDPVLATDLANGFLIQLNVGATGSSYYALVSSPVLSLVRARSGRTLAAESCVIVKSGTGVSCPGTTTTKKTTT